MKGVMTRSVEEVKLLICHNTYELTVSDIKL